MFIRTFLFLGIFILRVPAVAAETLDESLEKRIYALKTYRHVAGHLEAASHREVLAEYEKILETICRADPFLNHFFYSDQFKRQYGPVLKKVILGGTSLGNVSAETVPLNVHSAFGDKTKLPMLIKLTPAAFSSLSFLRSILVHELNHVCLYKDSQMSNPARFSGGALERPRGKYAHYFKSLNPSHPTYQFYLVHEFYSFKAQLIYDQRAPLSTQHRLDAANKKNVRKMLEWTYLQLNPKNKQFIKANPMPPISRWLTEKNL